MTGQAFFSACNLHLQVCTGRIVNSIAIYWLYLTLEHGGRSPFWRLAVDALVSPHHRYFIHRGALRMHPSPLLKSPGATVFIISRKSSASFLSMPSAINLLRYSSSLSVYFVSIEVVVLALTDRLRGAGFCDPLEPNGYTLNKYFRYFITYGLSSFINIHIFYMKTTQSYMKTRVT